MRLEVSLWAFFFMALPAFSEPVDRIVAPPADLLENTPAEFTRFEIADHSEDAAWLNRYLRYHFHHRSGNGKTLFNAEYLTTSDLWLSGATDEGRGKSIQEVHREDLLGVEIDPEGYVHTHQHFSHAHDWGWPFPMWTQAWNHPDGVRGVAGGWHFQKDRVPGWVGDYLRNWNQPEWSGETAVSLWGLENLESRGIENERWKLKSTGASPALISPATAPIDAFNAPYLQIRWKRSGPVKGRNLPYVEWMREGDEDFSPERRVHFGTDEELQTATEGLAHSHVTMHRHPLWEGKIKRFRISLAPGESDVEFEIDSIFTVYDTRHTINNPILILASWKFFQWTGDLPFLKDQINRLRLALLYQMKVMGGLEYNRIRNPWPNHDGIPGWVRDEKGVQHMQPGHGIGNNYWDLMPFGWDDLYATNQYYASLVAMARIEDLVRRNPGWGVPLGALALDPDDLRSHAAEVKEHANEFFWDEEKGRFIACVDKNGRRWEYGYTFLNLDSIWYGLASEEHAREIMDWITGKRIVQGDTSVGEDIFHWRFGPRATTLRNVEWYGQGWLGPESLPWGGQVQDGGAVLGFSFYDLWARLQVYGPDDAWHRLRDILDWEREVWAEGGYREYYKDGKRGTTLQGGGTAGGLGIDHEFYESSLIPSIMTYGFLGLDPDGETLHIAPQIPSTVPRMGVQNLFFRGARLDLTAEGDAIEIDIRQPALEPIRIGFDQEMQDESTGEAGKSFSLDGVGVRRYSKVK